MSLEGEEKFFKTLMPFLWLLNWIYLGLFGDERANVVTNFSINWNFERLRESRVNAFEHHFAENWLLIFFRRPFLSASLSPAVTTRDYDELMINQLLWKIGLCQQIIRGGEKELESASSWVSIKDAFTFEPKRKTLSALRMGLLFEAGALLVFYCKMSFSFCCVLS